jgi:hypothetical protein|nr:MAG TPA: hypothetical protein [Caudoviricetes sp.]
MALSKEDKLALVNLIDIIGKLDDGAKKYLLGVADGMAMAYKEKRVDPAEEKDIA